MVLDDAATASADSFADSFADKPNASDSDAYASPWDWSPDGTQDERKGPIRWEELPKAMPILGPLLGFTQQRRESQVNTYLQQMEDILQRPLTWDESMTMAHARAKIASITSYGTALGVLAGTYKCYETRATFTFPLYRPAGGFNPDLFGPLRGQQARLAYHTLRLPVWWTIGFFGGEIVSQLLGTLIVSTNLRTDTHVGKALMKELSAKMAAYHASGSKSRGMEARNRQKVGDEQSDASPAVQEGAGAMDTDVLSDDQARIQESRQRPAQSRSRTEDRADGLDMVTSQQASFDDASPTGGLGPMDTRFGTTSDTGGSSWDRLRQQASSGQQQRQQQQQQQQPSRSSTGGIGRPVQREQRSGSSMGDSFTFSSTEEERQLARSEAQKEFDARVDKERNGGDFEDSGKRW